jgi:prepilin peptidase CpaA
MHFFNQIENWPVVVICIGMLAAAIIDWAIFKVPNKLTFPLIFAGWALGLAVSFGWIQGYQGGGGFPASFLGTFLGLALILPIYSIGGMGAGDCKMTMGFGAWVGAFFGMSPGMSIIFWAFCVGAIIGGVIAAVMIAVRGNYKQNAKHVQEIMGDLFAAPGIGEIADRANKRRPRWHRLPYGVPLCIGFLGYLVYAFEICPTQTPDTQVSVHASQTDLTAQAARP